MKFGASKTYQCIKFSGLYSLAAWIIIILLFVISFLYAQIDYKWGAVGWVVPAVASLVFLFVFSVLFAYCIFVYYKEFLSKGDTYCPLLISKADNLFFNLPFKTLVLIFALIAFGCNVFFTCFIGIYVFIIPICLSFIIFYIADVFKNKSK